MRKGLFYLWAAVGFSIALLLSASTVYADIGPAPPTMDFTFGYQIPKTPIVNAQLLLCDDASCAQSEPFVDPPNWSGRPAILDCDGDTCWAWAGGIGFKRYHKLVVMFADKIRESNVFTKIAYGARYVVTVGENDLSVREIFSPDSLLLTFFSPFQYLCFIPASILTLISETAIAALYSTRIKTLIKGAGWANIISLPIVWFVFPFVQLTFGWTFLLAELFAVVFEAGFLFSLNHRTGLSWRQASTVSVLMNVGSVIVGIVAILLVIVLITLPNWFR